MNLDELAKEQSSSKTNLDEINPKIKSDIKNKTKKLIEKLEAELSSKDQTSIESEFRYMEKGL